MLTARIGFFSGILSGMGVGGGMLLIPALRIFFDISQKNAQAINLFCFIPAAVCALIVHIKKKNVILKLVIPIALFGVLGSIVGAFLANYLSSEILKKAFGIFLFVVGCFEIKKGLSQKQVKKRPK